MDYEYFTEEYVEKKDHAASVQLKRLLSRLPVYCKDLADSLTTYSPVTLLHRMRDLDDFFEYVKNKTNYQGSLYGMSASFLCTEVTDLMVKEWLPGTDRNESLSLNSQKRRLGSLRLLYDYIQIGLPDFRDPTSDIAISGQSPKDKDALMGEHIKIFLDYAEKLSENGLYIYRQMSLSDSEKTGAVSRKLFPARDYLSILILWETGIQTGDLVALNTDDIDIQGKQIRAGIKENYIFPVSDKLAALLSLYLKEVRPILSPNAHNENALLISSKHTRISCRAIQNVFASYSKSILKDAAPISPRDFSKKTYHI